MSEIAIETLINAPIQRCFDLSRSIDLHIESSKNTQEKAIDGKKEGLIELNEFVKWEAVHFHLRFYLTVKITKFDSPVMFTDEMINGNFKSMKHEHHFSMINTGTLMKDVFKYELPYGLLGYITDNLFLYSYLKNFLTERNKFIKEAAETERWKVFLKH